MVSLPLEPSLARALIAATQLGCLSQATTVAAMLSAESIFQGNRSGHACITVNACTNALSLHPSLLSCSRLNPSSRATGSFVQKKKRKGEKRQDCACWRQLDEKPSIVPGCPGRSGHACITVNAQSMHSSLLACESIFEGNRSSHACITVNALSMHSSLLSCSLLSTFSRATGQVMHVPQSMPCQCMRHCCRASCQVHLPESTNRSGCANALSESCYP